MVILLTVIQLQCTKSTQWKYYNSWKVSIIEYPMAHGGYYIIENGDDDDDDVSLGVWDIYTTTYLGCVDFWIQQNKSLEMCLTKWNAHPWLDSNCWHLTLWCTKQNNSHWSSRTRLCMPICVHHVLQYVMATSHQLPLFCIMWLSSILTYVGKYT